MKYFSEAFDKMCKLRKHVFDNQIDVMLLI